MSHTANTHLNSLPINASPQVSGTSSLGSNSTISHQPQNAYIRLPHGSNNSLPCTIQTFTSQDVNGSEQAADGSVLHAINKHEGKQRKITFAYKGFTSLFVIDITDINHIVSSG